MSGPLSIFIIAGEASGDFLGAGLMRALQEKRADISFSGIGGSRMMAAGLHSLFPMEELSVMGLAEVLPRLFGILARINQTAEAIIAAKPDAIVTIDSPDFCFRVLKKVKALGSPAPRIHYVAPSVWAWRPGRAKKVARFLSHLLTLLPFEPPYFEKHGLAATFVGHPIVERADRRGDAARFRTKFNIAEGRQILCLLPGSRVSELTRLLDDFAAATEKILEKNPDLLTVIPTLPHLKPRLERFFAIRRLKPLLLDNEEDKFDCFAASHAALAASGTVSLELALTETPHVISYKFGALSAMIARRLIKTPYANLVNIILQKPLVPELIQENCTPDKMAAEITRLLQDPVACETQKKGFSEALARIGFGAAETPSQKAARAVLSVIAG